MTGTPFSCLLYSVCGLIITHDLGLVFKRLRSNAGFEVGLVIGDGLEALPRGHDLVVRVGFADLSLGIDLVHGKVAGPVEVKVGIECVGIKAVDGAGMLLRDVAVAHEFADDSAVLAFGQCIVIGLARTRAGKFDAQLFQKLGHFPIDIFSARVGMKPPNFKREALEQQRDHGQQISFADALH